MIINKKTSMLKRDPLLILMDGHAMVYRAWHAIKQPLTIRNTGEEVGAVFGFLNTFLRCLEDLQPTHCAIAFDVSGPTFRHVEYDAYKAQRPPMPPELYPQFDRIRHIMDAFGIPIFEYKGYEADDVLGTLCRQAEEQDMETMVLTGDTDELQLVSNRVRVLLSYSVQGKVVYDVAKVRERYGGLGPNVIPDIKALQGDTSDNIPGVPGVGTKTAIRLLNEYQTVEGIYQNLRKVTPPRIQKSLEDHKELALKGKFLTTIVRDVPLKLDMKKAEFWRYNRSEVVESLTELEFFSMVQRIPDVQDCENTVDSDDIPVRREREPIYTTVTTQAGLDSLLTALNSSQVFSFDIETTGLNPMETQLVGLSFATLPNRGWYVPVGHIDGVQLSLDQVLDAIRPVMTRQTVSKVAHNANFDLTVLYNYGIQVTNLVFDTMLAAHVSGRKAISLKALALECLHVEMTPISELIGTGKNQITMADVAIDRAAPYAAADADVTLQLYFVFQEEMEGGKCKEAFDAVEMPLVPVLVRMQMEGIALDVNGLGRMSEELGGQISRIETDIYRLVGHQFNLKSAQQLGDVLFKELRLPPTKRTKTGYSTDASSLEGVKRLLDQGKDDIVDPKVYEVLDEVLAYRQLTKIKSTYVDSLPTMVNLRTRRVHTRYNQTGSVTGRVSSNDPNIQNIPVRTDLGRRVRDAFVAQQAPDWLLLGADYSQIELRILAHLSKDPSLLEAFETGQDIHASTASQVYDVPLEQVVPDMRRIAKTMNFGVIYGLSPFGISQQTGLSPDEGKKFINTYFGRYPGIRDYIDCVKAEVAQNGYVETLMGRRRYIPEINSRSFHVRAAGERMAINMPVQGTAADVIKIAMVRIQERLDSKGLRSLMIIQVHDELIFESPQNELEDLRSIILEVMPSAMNLAVPLHVELKVGSTWGNMQ